MSNLVLVEHHHDQLHPSTLNTIKAASLAGGQIDLLVLGENISNVVQVAASIAGISKVLQCSDALYANQTAEDIAPLLASLARDYKKVWAPATTFGKNIMPRAAALCDVQQISDISAVIDHQTFERPIYAGNAVCKLKSEQELNFITVRTTMFEAAEDQGGNAEIANVGPQKPSNLSRFKAIDSSNMSERPELTSARIIISGGRGMQSGENFAMLENIADRLGAAVGASRAAVDAGFVPNDYQVGQTGKVVAPDLYIAVGISGAIQHLAGMKDSKIIVAINKDDEAPIFQVADYGLVADLFEALPALQNELEK
ncbi:MAG: FAD-binding protein [Pseudomonadota bacterium]